jgi:hypothetical protein
MLVDLLESKPKDERRSGLIKVHRDMTRIVGMKCADLAESNFPSLSLNGIEGGDGNNDRQPIVPIVKQEIHGHTSEI